MVVLRAGDSGRFETSKKAVSLSLLVGSMLSENTCDSDDNEEIPLVCVTSRVLGKVVEFLEYYVTVPIEESTVAKGGQGPVHMCEVVNGWYAEFIDTMDRDMLFDLTLAANYLEIPPLLSLTTTKIAVLLHNCCTLAEIKTLLGVERDLSVEEERQIRENHKWIFDLFRRQS